MDDFSPRQFQAPGTVLQIQPHHTARREFGDESVVLDLHRSLYFGLNRSAGVLWQRLLSGATRGELVDLLVADGAPQASADQVGQDVDDFVGALRKEGLIRDVDA